MDDSAVERAADLIFDHPHLDYFGDCGGGCPNVGGTGISHHQHLARVLADAGLLITDEARAVLDAVDELVRHEGYCSDGPGDYFDAVQDVVAAGRARNDVRQAAR